MTGHLEGPESVGVRLGLGSVGRVLGPNHKGPGQEERGESAGPWSRGAGQRGSLSRQLRLCCAGDFSSSFYDCLQVLGLVAAQIFLCVLGI